MYIGMMINMVGVGVIKQVMKDMGSKDTLVAIKGIIFMVIVATQILNTSEEIIRTTMSQKTRSSQNKTFIGRSGMNVYKAGVIHCDYTPYNACFTGMYCIIPLFR